MSGKTATTQWICDACTYVYDQAEGDPRTGVAPGTPFDEIADRFECPSCGGPGDGYSPLEPGSDR